MTCIFQPSDREFMDRPHQRIGSVSNAHVGADFERVALEFFARQGIVLSRNFPVELGLSQKKVHCFDLGTAKEKILVEFDTPHA